MVITPPSDFRGVFRTDDAARAVYSEAAGIARSMPLAIAVPRDEADVAALVRWARAGGTPLIPRGSGSSMAGGAIGPGVIVDLSRLTTIEPVDRAARTVRAHAGAVCADVDRAARAQGLRFPVDPSSARFCTVGGMASTNAAGAHSLRFGATRPWVRALRCVFDDGRVVDVRRGEPVPEVTAVTRFTRSLRDDLLAHGRELSHSNVRKDSSGYGLAAYAGSGELVDLLVGSEGTLAIVVAVELDLAPIAAATSSVLGSFVRLEDAVAAAARAAERGAVACELLDRTFLDVAASGRELAVPSDTEAALLAEVEASDANEAAAIALGLQAMFREEGASLVRVALDRATEHELWELRHAASPILARLDPSLRSMQFIEDGAVPLARLADYVRGVRGILDGAGVRGVVFGHAGDAHVHVNPLVDVSAANWRAVVERILAEGTALVARLGGTLAGEHGDGRLRTPLLAHVWNEESVRMFARVKEVFDPANILNPGVKVPMGNQTPLADIKYDPSLAPLPAASRRALDTVERERAYARFRLDLLDA